MLNISNTLLSYADRGLSSVSQATQSAEIEHKASPIIFQQETNQVSISEEARYALLAEKQESKQEYRDEQLAHSIDKSDRQKVQAQENIELYIEAAQRYSQQNIAPPAIENRQAISAYSLIENKVVPTNASNSLES